jgi:hypothetical protein
MLDWREEAKKHGIQNPDAILQQVIDTAVARPDDAGGDDGDSETEGDGDEAAPEE